MRLFEYLASRGYSAATEDDLLYEFLASELESGVLHKGAWTKALAESGFEEKAAKSKYVIARVATLREEVKALRPQLEQVSQARQRLSDLVASGCTQEIIDYLGNPIQAAHYLTKYGLTAEKLKAAVSLKKVKAAAFIGDVLWIEDKRF